VYWIRVLLFNRNTPAAYAASHVLQRSYETATRSGHRLVGAVRLVSHDWNRDASAHAQFGHELLRHGLPTLDTLPLGHSECPHNFVIAALEKATSAVVFAT
jgi:hypothetical protein